MESPPAVVFPRSLLATLSGTFARHTDGREFTLDLFGIVFRTANRTIYIPQFLMGTGIDRVRRWGSCSTDPGFRENLCEQLSAMQHFAPQYTWIQLGNVHSHPGGSDTPSRHTDVPSARAYLKELSELPWYLTGIVHEIAGERRLRMHAIDRAGTCHTVPWSVADISSIAHALDDVPAWISAPLTLRNRERWLRSRRCDVVSSFGRDGRATITARRGTELGSFTLRTEVQ